MNWYQNPYFGQTAEKKKDLILQRLQDEDCLLLVHLITLPPTKENQLEIISPRDYRIQAKRHGEPLIIGLACGMREAKQVTVQIVSDVYRRTGTADVRKFFES